MLGLYPTRAGPAGSIRKHGGFGTRIPTPTLKLVYCVIVKGIVSAEVQNKSIYREFREIEIPKPRGFKG